MSADAAKAGDVVILISDITAAAKTRPHPVVLDGTSGSLDESVDGRHVFVSKSGSHEHGEGPKVGQLYKLRFNVAGTYEIIQQMIYMGYAGEYGRYVFTKKP